MKKLLIILMTVMLLGGVIACEKKGPAEEAGEKVDKALHSAKDALNDALKK